MHIFKTAFCVSATLFAAGACNAQTAPKFSLLYTFGLDGGYPSSLTEISRGTFYGTGTNTSSGFSGAIFRIDSAGTFGIVHQFPAHFAAYGGLQVMNGQFFGWGLYDQGGFNYQYFSMPLSGNSVNVYPTGSFGEPYLSTPAIPSPDGHLFHVVRPAPLMADFVKVDLLGNITNLHTFNDSTEGVPWDGSNLVEAKDGSFYGIATVDNTSTIAWFFKIDSGGNYTKLAEFPSYWLGGVPAPLIMSPSGAIYGTFANGGTNLRGMLYKYVPGGQITTLYNFPKAGVVFPNALILASDGNLYGGTRTSPTVLYAFNLKTNQFHVLYQMNDGQGSCQCALVQGSDGKIYGAALTGGSGPGTIFSLDMGLAPPKPKVSLFSPTSGSSGQKILLWGKNLLGATAVTFNGVAALGFGVTSSYSVFATVPPGATSGPITIATPAGSFQTTSNFTIP